MSAQRYADLARLSTKTVTTAQAAAAWRTSSSVASRSLAGLARAGLIERLRHGLWLIDRSAVPEALAAEITAPYPAYVSHVSALYTLGIIEQVPNEIHAVSVGEPRAIRSGRGRFRIHRVPIVLFGGFNDQRGYPMATAEKALFDWAYLSVAAGHANARLPETEWPASFRRSEIERWLRRIESARLRTLTSSLIDRRLASHR